MTKLLMIYLGFLLIKAVTLILPRIIKPLIFKTIPRRNYDVNEVIKCKHMRPDLYYKKQLQLNEVSHKEIEVDTIRELFKEKMKHRKLTRSQILAIRQYLEGLIDCKEKKFDNDCHCIYYCLKRLDKEEMLDLTALANLLQ